VETEKRASGGIVIVIEVQELPLISQVKIEGLKGINESDLFEALLHEEIDVRPGRVYDMAMVKTAISVVGKILASHGQPDAVIEERTEFLTATSVVLVFSHKGQRVRASLGLCVSALPSGERYGDVICKRKTSDGASQCEFDLPRLRISGGSGSIYSVLVLVNAGT